MVPESISLPSFIAPSTHEYFLCVKLMPAKHTISFTLPDSKQLVGLPIKETLQILYKYWKVSLQLFDTTKASQLSFDMHQELTE